MPFQDDNYKLALRYKLIYSMAGLFLGLACIVAGAILGLFGAVSKTSWTAEFLGLSSKLTDATPGIVVFVVGIFIVLITRFGLKVKTVEANQAPANPATPPSVPDSGGGYRSTEVILNIPTGLDQDRRL